MDVKWKLTFALCTRAVVSSSLSWFWISRWHSMRWSSESESTL